MRENKIRIPNYYHYAVMLTKEKNDFSYCELLDGVGCAVDQSKVGEELITLNYFPTETEDGDVFLKQ